MMPSLFTAIGRGSLLLDGHAREDSAGGPAKARFRPHQTTPLGHLFMIHTAVGGTIPTRFSVELPEEIVRATSLRKRGLARQRRSVSQAA